MKKRINLWFGVWSKARTKLNPSSFEILTILRKNKKMAKEFEAQAMTV
jgi:hypothetical protein